MNKHSWVDENDILWGNHLICNVLIGHLPIQATAKKLDVSKPHKKTLQVYITDAVQGTHHFAVLMVNYGIFNTIVLEIP